MTDFTLRPLTVPERKYTYAQSSQLQGQTGNIGYLRGDFGSTGKEFYSSWFDNMAYLKTPEFQAELDTVVNALRVYQPAISKVFERLLPYYYTDKEQEMIDRNFPLCENISVDYAIMEKAEAEAAGILKKAEAP